MKIEVNASDTGDLARGFGGIFPSMTALDSLPCPLLLLDTAGKTGGAGALLRKGIFFHARVPAAENIGRRLFVTVGEVCRTAGLKPADVRGILVNVGPGSWTGLRVGVAAAKTLAWTLKAQLAGYSNLEALALEALAKTFRNKSCVSSRRIGITALLNGRSAGLFGARFIYRLQGSPSWEQAVEQTAASPSRWLERIAGRAASDETGTLEVVAGNALPRLREASSGGCLPDGVIPVELPDAGPTPPAAVAVGLRVWTAAENRLSGKAIHGFAPQYMRSGHFRRHPSVLGRTK